MFLLIEYLVLNGAAALAPRVAAAGAAPRGADDEMRQEDPSGARSFHGYEILTKPADMETPLSLIDRRPI